MTRPSRDSCVVRGADLRARSADDVQQEVWLSISHLRDLADPGAFRTWLFRTTRHRAIDFLRRRKRERELIDDVPLEEVAVARRSWR